ncbi:MAG: SpoIID/LytB domain-containing protein [Oscillospiraceae bacterium]|nr:SpoIID/LytB domain-containing protein [Oscillospiraceae bacterium]
MRIFPKKRIIFKVLIPVLMVACVFEQLVAPVSAAAYEPPYQTLKIGLYFGTTALPSANLQNVEGFGGGFEFGYFDSSRNFVPINVDTSENRITMLMDRNMTWYTGDGTSAGEYREGTNGDVVIGCFHIQLNTGYDSFAEAKSEASKYKNAFVRYQSGKFIALIGQYTSRDAANTAIESMELKGASINAGTSNTITISRTGTNTILFEFDMGQTPLGVMPKPKNNVKSETWFKGFRYTGGFQYARFEGMFITVINFVAIEDYIKGILPNEMGASWPLEALKAQACCARSYALSTLNRHNANGFDLCVTEHCQVYRGRNSTNERTDQAVEETVGKYITYDGNLCQTFYASSNGGASESVENVWNDPEPYLRGVVDPYEADIAPSISNYKWTIRYTQSQITERLRERGYNCSTIVSIVISKFTPTGNVLSITMTDSKGKKWGFSKRSELITALGVPTQRFSMGSASAQSGSIFVNNPTQKILPGPVFYAVGANGTPVEISEDNMSAITASGDVIVVEGEKETDTGDATGMENGVFTISGTGRGHLVGMSQWGAYSMALNYNKTYIEIIKFYFTGVDVG